MRKELTPRCALVLAVCIAVYWLMLGSSSFAMSEAQRALPAWEMADRGEYLIPYLFDQPYLRKPPGTQWLIMMSGEVFGRTEFAARLPSALCMTLGALASTLFAARWFGVRYSHWAGVAHALTPLYWYPGRAAEIESPHNFFVQVCVLATIDLLARTSRSTVMSLIVGIGAFGAAMTKGPAGVPCVIAGAIACSFVNRSWTRWIDVRWISGLLVGVCAASLVFILIARRAAHLDPVTQSPAEFLWNASKAPQILALLPVTIFAATPACLGLLTGFTSADVDHSKTIRAVTNATIIALLIYTVAGVYNNRYSMPAMTISSVLFAPLFAMLGVRDGRMFRRLRVALVAMLSVLFCGSFVHTAWSETRRERISGRKAGEAIAASLQDGEEVWANHAIEYRAEILHYAKAEAARRGIRITPKWMPSPGKGEGAAPASGTAMIVLMDGTSVRCGARFEYEATQLPTTVRELVHKYYVELRRAP